MIRPPSMTPRKTMSSGSSKEVKAATAVRYGTDRLA